MKHDILKQHIECPLFLYTLISEHLHNLCQICLLPQCKTQT